MFIFKKLSRAMKKKFRFTNFLRISRTRGKKSFGEDGLCFAAQNISLHHNMKDCWVSFLKFNIKIP